jgi:hypothetical protein
MKRLLFFLKKLFSKKTLDPPIFQKEEEAIKKYTGQVTFFEPIDQQERFNKADSIDDFLNIKL